VGFRRCRRIAFAARNLASCAAIDGGRAGGFRVLMTGIGGRIGQYASQSPYIGVWGSESDELGRDP
jgi:hypothetical protein